MDQVITAEEIIDIIEKSDLDATIKEILVRDVKNEGVNDFLLEQVIAYCDNAVEKLEKISKSKQDQNPA